MRLHLFHPGVARIDCRDCVKRLYDLKTGEPIRDPRGPLRILHDFTVKDGHIAPCRAGTKCAKESPENAHKHEISKKNQKTLLMFFRKQHGGDVGPCDTLLADNFRLIGNVWSEYKRQQQLEISKAAVVQVMQAIMPMGR